MRIPWKIIGLAGLAGVAATGVVARRRRVHRTYSPDELRSRLRQRLTEASSNGDRTASPSTSR
jgi:hypothetical protein